MAKKNTAPKAKRLTKRDVYAQYGIEYKDGKILSPLFGWINPLLINGNDKLGKGVWTWSMLPTNKSWKLDIDGVSYEIKGTCPCHCDGCYAMTGFYTVPSTKVSLARKTLLAYQELPWLTRAIIAQIKADKIRLFRIHAAGDFFSAEYNDLWRTVAMACPETIFWSYTKYAAAVHAFDDLPNINIVKSILPGLGFNFGKIEYIMRAYAALKAAGKDVYICRCGIDDQQHCTHCHGCFNHEYVLFIEHSTDYVAAKDPLYPEIVKLIESQEAPEAWEQVAA